MNILKYLSLVFLFTFSFSFSQITNEKEFLLCKTFRFLHEQTYTLKKIEQKYPELKSLSESTQLSFNLKFQPAIKKIIENTKLLFGENYEECLYNYTKELALKSLTKQQALNFINKVKDRRFGKIESPILEILLAYQFQNNPINEYLSHQYYTSSVENYSNLEKLELKINIPKSWKESYKSKSSPNVLKIFSSEFGSGNENIIISKKNNLNLNEFLINIDNLKKELKSTDKIVSIKKGTMNLREVGIIHFENTIKDIKKSTLRYVVAIDENNLLQVDCFINEKIYEELTIKFRKFKPLFDTIFGSIQVDFNEISKSNNRIFTYKNN